MVLFGIYYLQNLFFSEIVFEMNLILINYKLIDCVNIYNID